MNKIFGIALVCIGLGISLVGCSSYVPEEEISSPSAVPGQLKLSFSIGGIEARSPELDASGAGTFATGDELLLSLKSDADKLVHQRFVIGQSGLEWAGLGFPEGTSEVSVAGCYPVPADVEGETLIFDVTAQGEKDLLLAKAQQVPFGSEAVVNMSFEHAMHQLNVVYLSKDASVSDAELEAIRTSLVAATKCVVNLKEGAVEKAVSESRNEYPVAQGKEVSFLAVPQQNENVLLRVRVEGQDKEFVLPQQTNKGLPLTELKGGTRVTLYYNVARKADEVSITFAGADIAGWEDGGMIDGSIEL